MLSIGAARSRTEDRATLESDPSADPEAGMAGERANAPRPPLTQSHLGTKALNSALSSTAAELTHQLGTHAQPTSWTG